jgi:hypothetical protein
MQTCPTCHYVSPLGDQFCRQCGTPLTAAAQSSNNSVKGRWLVIFLIVLLVGIGLGTLLASRQVNRTTSRRRIEAVERHATLTRVREVQQSTRELIREAQERRHTLGDRVRESAERAAEAGAAIATRDLQPLDLSEYEYPGANVGNYSRIPGYEMLQLRTKASFEAIKDFYQQKLGKPLLFINDGDEDKSLFFQSNSTPAVFVTVEYDDDSGRWLITITRAPFQFPQPDAPKAASGAAKQ